MSIEEVSQFDDEIYELSIYDKALGGKNGVANRQAMQLANRTRWLKAKLEELQGLQIKEMAINEAGHLLVTLGDDSTQDLGSVVGPQGVGMPSGGLVGQLPVKASVDDFDFVWVDMPVDGDTGTGISGATINDEGHLILALSNGSFVDAGTLPGGGSSYPEAFDDYFENRSVYERGGGYYDIAKAGYSRENGKRATKHGDLVTFLPNLAPNALGGPATPAALLGSEGILPLPLALRRDVRYTTDPDSETYCEYRNDIPMLYNSEEYFDHLREHKSDPDFSAQFIAGLSPLAFKPGLDMKQCPGITLAVVVSMTLADLTEIGMASLDMTAGAGMALYGSLPGVSIFTIDFEKLLSAEPDAIKAWRDGVLAELPSTGSTDTPAEILAQFQTADGNLMLAGAGMMCVAFQAALVLSRPISDEEAADITERLQASMVVPDETYEGEEVCIVTPPPPYHLSRIRLEAPPETEVESWDLGFDMPASVLSSGGDQATLIKAWLLSEHSFDCNAELAGSGYAAPFDMILEGTYPEGGPMEKVLISDHTIPQVYMLRFYMMSEDGTSEASSWWWSHYMPESVVDAGASSVIDYVNSGFMNVMDTVQSYMASMGQVSTPFVYFEYVDADSVTQTMILYTDVNLVT